MSQITTQIDSGGPAGPVRPSQRIVSLDVLRGFAVLGILIMNVQSFSMIGAAYMNPTAYGDLEGANFRVWQLSHLLADQKFFTIFSMLFGAGIIVMTSRREAAGLSPASLHYRRMIILVAFGLLHGYLLWYGDILYFYGVCGLLVYLLRGIRPWLQIAIGVAAIAVASGLSLLFGLSMPMWPEAQVVALEAESWMPAPEFAGAEIEAYRGSWLDQMSHRVPTAFFFQTFVFLIGVFWKVSGLMLIGMALFRLGVLSAARAVRFYVAMLVIGAGLGLPIIAYGAHQNMAHDWEVEYSFFLGSQYNYWASILVALAYVALVMLACLWDPLRTKLWPLAAVGRMALTNYLLQTIICTTIFYGHGFGLFGSFSRVEQVLTVLAVWAFQLVASPLWLRWFRFGPFEWLWRSLSYMTLQPMSARPAEPPPAGPAAL